MRYFDIFMLREDTPSKVSNHYRRQNDVKAIFYEIDFRETKWLKCGTYHHQNDDYYFYKLGRSIDLFKFILIGGFNSEKSE